MAGNPDIEQLRRLLFGKDYDSLLALKAQLENTEHYTANVASVISEALALRASQDDSISEVMGPAFAPMVEETLSYAIQRDSKRFADILYPVMGPAIRKSIQQALNEAMSNINQLLEQGLSLRSWRWRFDAWRTGQSYAQIALLNTLVYQVEQVFLIHKETGLLLQHVVSEHAISKDPEIVSSMLTAIQDFIQDSFVVDHGDTLDTLRLGELSVMIEHGTHAVTALVVRGTPPGELRTLLADTSENIHLHFSRQFQEYDGDVSLFAGVVPYLNECIQARQQHAQQKRKNWPIYLLSLALLAGASYWGWQHYEKNHKWHTVIDTLKAEPGIVVTDTQQQGGNYVIQGLIDPLARPPEQVIPQILQQELPLQFKLEPYLSLNSNIQTERQKAENAKQRAAANQQQSEQAALMAQLRNLNQAEQQRRQEEAQQRQQAETALKQNIQNLIRQIETTNYTFEVAKVEIKQDSPQLNRLGNTIMELLSTTLKNRQIPQISIMGNTDDKGSKEKNELIAQQRANNMRDTLITQGVPPFLLRTAPGKQQKNARDVSFKVSLY